VLRPCVELEWRHLVAIDDDGELGVVRSDLLPQHDEVVLGAAQVVRDDLVSLQRDGCRLRVVASQPLVLVVPPLGFSRDDEAVVS